MEYDDLYAALLHEMKNNLALLTMSLDNIPACGDEHHDRQLAAARMLGQKTADRLTQTLLIYKSTKGDIVLSAVDAHSPEDFVHELAQQTRSFNRKLEVTAQVEADVPAIWFFDRNMLEMALLNAIHNSVNYARQRVEIRAGLRDGMLAISIRDDSGGYPAHIMAAVTEGKPLQSEGTGLGLRFARLIAEAHRNDGRAGELRLYNEDGAVFEIRVP